MKESTRVLASLGAAIALGLLVGASGSDALRHATDFLVPIGALWVSAIRMTVIPLVASLIITSIASASDVRAVSKLGGRTLVVFVAMLAGAAAVAIPLARGVFSFLPPAASRPALPAGAAEAAAALAADQPQTLAGWIGSLLPSNPVAAAASGAMVQLVLFVFLLALAIARSNETTRATLVAFFQALGDAMLTLVRWVILATPIGVFALILPLAARSGASLVGGIGFYIVAYSLLSIATSLALYPVVLIATGTPMGRFARAALPAQLVAFSTSSSIASLPALVESAEVGLGLSREVPRFVLPLAVSMFKFAAPVSWSVGTLFVGWFYGIPISLGALATVAFAAVFLAFAAPGVPRGAFIMLAPLFNAIGLPVEGIGILIAVDVLPDVFATTLNVTGNLAATAMLAGRRSARSS